MPAYDLWITARCARDDLHLDPWPDPDGVLDVDHPAVRKFRERRSVDPEPNNMYIDRLKQHPCYSLHDERARGATWFDKANNVVFLLAHGQHAEDSRDDFYTWVVDLEQRGLLYPDLDGPEYYQLEIFRADRMLRQLYQSDGPAYCRRVIASGGELGSLSLEDGIAFLSGQRIGGGWRLRLRLDPLPGSIIKPANAANLAQAILGRLAAVVEPAVDFEWEGEVIPFGSWIFEALIYDEALGP